MRKIIKQYLSSLPLTNNNTALLLSGGIDSSTLLFSLLDIGIKPTCYSFKLENRMSCDFDNAKLLCERFNLKFVPIIINDTNIDLLIQDVKYIIRHFKTNKKTSIQVLYAFVKMSKYIKEEYVVSGICVDTLHGNSKEFAMANNRNPIEYNERRKQLAYSTFDSSFIYIKMLFEEVGKFLVAPYKQVEIIDFFLSLPYEETMHPIKKQARIAYPELLKYNLTRHPLNLQIGSGIKEWHDCLLKQYPTYKSVVGIYNRFYNDIFKKNGTQIQLSLEFN